MITPADDQTIEDQLTLENHGVPVKTGRMNSYEVAACIIAFSEFLGIVSHSSVVRPTQLTGIKKSVAHRV